MAALDAVGGYTCRSAKEARVVPDQVTGCSSRRRTKRSNRSSKSSS